MVGLKSAHRVWDIRTQDVLCHYAVSPNPATLYVLTKDNHSITCVSVLHSDIPSNPIAYTIAKLFYSISQHGGGGGLILSTLKERERDHRRKEKGRIRPLSLLIIIVSQQSLEIG